MIINHNIASMNAFRNLNLTDVQMNKSLERLSSGLRINRAADDAAGLAISEKMRAQISGLDQAESNAQSGISLLQTAEGAMNETTSLLQRMRQLAVQSAADSATTADREQMQKEMDQLSQEMSRITNTTEFNTKNLLGGAFSGQLFQIGANANQTMQVDIGAMDAFTLGVTAAKGVTVANSLTSTGAVASGSLLTAASLTTSATATSQTYTVTGSVTTAAVAGKVTVTDSGGGGGGSVTVTATQGGAWANSIQVQFMAPAGGSSAAAWVGSVLQVTVKTGGDTAANVVTAMQGATGTDPTGGKLTFTANNSSNFANAVAATNLAGGVDTVLSLTQTDQNGVAVQTQSVTATSTSGITATAAANWTNGINTTVATSAANALTTVGATIVTQYLDVVAATSTAATSAGNGLLSAQATVGRSLLITSQYGAQKAITALDTSINTVSNVRANLGAFQNRLEHTISNLGVTSENMAAAESRIRDVDMAKEMASFTRQQILIQAGTAMLAQANQKPQSVLQLIR